MTESFLEEMSELTETSKVELPDFRKQAAPGEIIQQGNVTEGMDVNWRKPASKMRMGNVELPERVDLYDRQRHDVSKVAPTIAQRRMADYPGRFTLRKPSDWTEPQAIESTCEICRIRREQDSPGSGPKKFYSQFDLIGHYRSFHEREWEALESDRRDTERREEQGQMRQLIATIAGMIQPGQAARLPVAIREQITQLQGVTPADALVTPSAVECAVCRKVLNSRVALTGHSRSHKET